MPSFLEGKVALGLVHRYGQKYSGVASLNA
jgi:hypothetical protein